MSRDKSARRRGDGVGPDVRVGVDAAVPLAQPLKCPGAKTFAGSLGSPSAPTRKAVLAMLCVLAGLTSFLLSRPASAQVTHGPPRIRNVYIPVDDLQLLFDSASKGVLMPRDKVLALWQDAQRRELSHAVPPAHAVWTQASYEAKLEDHELRVAGHIRLTALRDGWQAVDLPFGGLAIESAQLAAEPARFGRREDGALFLVLEKAGQFELELDMSAPLASKDGDLATTLKLPPVPASELRISLDASRQLQFGETVLQSDTTENGQQRFTIAVGPGGLVPLLISQRQASGNRSPLVVANSRSTGQIEPAGLRWEVAIDLHVYARATDTFRLQLPDSVDLAEVEAPELLQWTTRKQPDGTATLTLVFRKPLLGQHTVRLVGLAPFPTATLWNFPALKVHEAASHVGQVAVSSSPSLRVEVGTLAGIRPEMGQRMSFAFWEEGFKLPLRVTQRNRTVQASVATLVEVNRAGAALRSNATLQPRYTSVFDIQMQLPRDWNVTSVLCAGQPVPWDLVSPVEADPAHDAAQQTIRVDLAQPISPGQSLEIALTAQRNPSQWLEQEERFHELPLPNLRLVDADEVEGTILIQAPPDIELLVSDLPDDLQPVAAEGPSSLSAQAFGTALQYRYRDDARKNARLHVRTKPAKVSVETLAYVWLDRGKLDVHYQLDLHIRQGMMRQIGFTLPAAAGEKFHIVPLNSTARVIEQRHSPLPGAGDGSATLSLWQIVFDRPVTGDLTLALDFGQTLSTPTPASGAAPAHGRPTPGESALQAGTCTSVPVIAFQNVARQSGILAVEAAGDEQIECHPENLRDLDPADVSKPKTYTPRHRIVAAYQYQRLPYGLTVSATRHASGSVLTAICESAEITSVAERQGRMRHQARFWLRALNLPHLPVRLPEDADLWSVMLDNNPVEVRRTRDALVVPLPPAPAGSANTPRVLTLLYETDGPPLTSNGLWGRLWPQTVRQKAPEIALTTLDTTWQVYPPDSTELVSSSGQFEPETPLTRPTLAAGLSATIAHESANGLPWKFAGLVAAMVLVGFVALLSTATARGMTLVEILVVLVVIGLLIALLLPATQSARSASRRAACLNNLKQIGLALQNYHSVYKRFPPATIGPANVPPERQFSWIVALLPFMEQKALYDQLRLDLPWDHPHNAALLKVSLNELLCPSDPSRAATLEGLSKTSYVAITGTSSTRGSGSTRGVIGFDQGLSLAEIVDGTSRTLVVAEVTDGGPWFAGGSATARQIDDLIAKNTWSSHPGGGNFLFADGSVRFISSTIDLQTLRHLATAQGKDIIVDSDFEEEAVAGTSTSAPAPAASEPQADRAPAEKEAKSESLVAAPTVQQNEPPPKVPPQPRVSDSRRARLSLSLSLQTDGTQPIRFRREGGPGELVLGLQDRTFSTALQGFMVAAALLGAWLWRRRPGPQRAIAAVVGLALPIGLSGLVPLAWTPLLDGLLLGTLAATTLWLLQMALAAIKRPASWAAPVVTMFIATLGLAAVVAAAEQPSAVEAKPPATAQPRQPGLTLFIPYDPARAKPLESSQVYLPHDEFLRLWNQAHPDDHAQAPPDLRAIVSHAEYSGRLRDDRAHFEGRLLVHQLADAWTPVVLPVGNVAFEKIEINGQPATVAGENRDQAIIYLDKPGLHVVDVRFSVPVTRLGATGQLTVPLRAVSSGRLQFQLPQADLEIQLSGSPGGWRRQSLASSAKAAPELANGSPSHDSDQRAQRADQPGDVVSIPIGAAGDLSIRWQPRRIEAREAQLVSADQILLAEVLDSGIHFHSKFRYRIQQGAIRELHLRIPPDTMVQAVEGAEVADWSIESDSAPATDPADHRLVISLKTEHTTDVDVDVHSLRRDRQATGAIGIHSLEPLGVVRETGRVAIGGSRQFHVRVDQADRMDQIDRAGLDLSRKPADGCILWSAYRYTSRPWKLQLDVLRDRPRVEVSDRTAVAITARQATMRSLLTLQIADAPIRSLALRLPPSLRVSEVRVPPGADWFIDADDKGRHLKVDLGEPAIGKLDVAVSGLVVRDSNQTEFTVPGLALEDTAAHRGQLAVHLDDDLQAVLANDSGARPIDPAALDPTLRPEGNRPVHYAFQYESPPKDLQLRLSSAPSRASASVTTVVSIREGAIAYISQIDFEIQQAGRAQLQVVTPRWLGEDIQWRGEQIRQIRSQVASQQRTWDIQLQQPVRGAYRLHLVQTLPLPDNGAVQAAIIRPLGVERSRGHIVLENVTPDEIAPTTTRGVEPVAMAAVPDGLTESVRRQAVAAYRSLEDNAALAWQRRVREQETGLSASISLADLTTVVDADGGYRARAAYNIRNFTLQFLELELPPDSQVWSLHVSGQPARPATIDRQGRPMTLVPLEKTSAGDFSSKVVIVYSGSLPEPLRLWSQIRPPAPRILSKVPVSRTLWTVLVPRQYQLSLVRGQSNLEEVGAAYQQEERKLSFLDELRQMLQVASTKRMSAARMKAQDNLKQAGAALHGYSQQAAPDDAINAADVQQQAQQLAAEVQRLEEVKTDARRIDDEAAFYFLQPQHKPKAAEPGVGPDRPEQGRGDLRKQAIEQLQRLRTSPRKEPLEKDAPPQKPADRPDKKPAAERDGPTIAIGRETTKQTPQDAQVPMDIPTPATGNARLPLDIDLTLVGTSHHFCKLHGEPRLVLRARHESLTRGMVATIWAGLSLVMAAVVVRNLRKSDARERALRGWPWLALVIGTVWWFLLPGGVFGLALFVTAGCVLTVRRPSRQPDHRFPHKAQ